MKRSQTKSQVLLEELTSDGSFVDCGTKCAYSNALEESVFSIKHRGPPSSDDAIFRVRVFALAGVPFFLSFSTRFAGVVFFSMEGVLRNRL